MKLSYCLTTLFFLSFSFSLLAQDIANNHSSLDLEATIISQSTQNNATPTFSITIENNTLLIKKAVGKLVIRTVTGQVVKQVEANNRNTTLINISDFEKGRYIVHAIQPNGVVATQKFSI